jgi:periplasmic divalent cation tolerance protein
LEFRPARGPIGQIVSLVVEFIQVSTTVDTEERATQVADKLLAERLASCVQILGPIKSSYWWSGKIERAREWICLIKAKASDYDRIESSIMEIHSYDVPEIIALPILRGNQDYLDWIRRETTPKLKLGTKRG